jgi:hypothetical protein
MPQIYQPDRSAIIEGWFRMEIPCDRGTMCEGALVAARPALEGLVVAVAFPVDWRVVRASQVDDERV